MPSALWCFSGKGGMVQTVRVTALKNFQHEGQPIAAGDLVIMAAVEALVLSRRGLVSLDAVRIARKDLSAEESHGKPHTTTKRSYKRRDMRAED